MDRQKQTDYFGLVNKEFFKLQGLFEERDELELQIAKSRQFIAATANMLTDRQRDAVLKKMAMVYSGKMLAESGLTDAIKSILQKRNGEWLTVTKARDALEVAGFNFGKYKSSPLASISTTLKRFKPEDVEKAEIDGVAAYRWVGTFATEELKMPFLSRLYGIPAEKEMGTLKDTK